VFHIKRLMQDWSTGRTPTTAPEMMSLLLKSSCAQPPVGWVAISMFAWKIWANIASASNVALQKDI